MKVIHHESELVHHFSQLLGDDPDLHWQIPPEAPIHERLPWVELKLDDVSHRFKPVYRLQPSNPELETLLADWEDSKPPLLVVPELSPRLLGLCRQRRLAAIDLNGRTFVRSSGLLVDRHALAGRDFRYRLEPRDVFVGKSLRIIRTLLTDRDRIWNQRVLVGRTGASSGLVSRIVQYLISQGFIEKKSAREFRLADPLGLVDAWAKSDYFARRVTTIRYSTLVADPYGIARELNTWARQQSVPIAFTQWLAAWLRHPYTEPIVTSAYVDQWPPDAATLDQLGLRRVDDAGKVWLHVPLYDKGLFLETRTVEDLPLVSDAQIYIDLQQTGLRGPDQAAALRHWEGFCRP